MSIESEKLENYLVKLDKFSLPDYEDFPPIDLYMEQVISYVSESLGDFYNGDDEAIITPFMVNNYVKAKIINPPTEKKYNRDHVAYLMAISLLKSVVPMKDIATFIDLDKNVFSDNRNLYDFFKAIQDETLKTEVHKNKIRLDSLRKTKHRPLKAGETEEDIETLNLSYIALRLYIQSETTKQLADEIMKEVGNKMLPKDVLQESRSETVLQNRKAIKEAKKIGNRK